jgi:undecaprenyl-diphosphatase
MNNFYIQWALHTMLESLPISSSGHMRLIQYYMCMKSSMLSKNQIQQKECAYTEIPEYLNYFMHITTFVIILLFLSMHIPTEIAQLLTSYTQLTSWQVIQSFITALIIANSATTFFYFLFKYKPIRFPLYAGFAITALLLLSLYVLPQREPQSLLISGMAALAIGTAQGIALLPGISRMAATYIIARWCSIGSATALLFSLAIQLPLIGAALVKAGYEIYSKNKVLPAYNTRGVVIVGCATIIAYGLLAGVYWMAGHNYIQLFGWYMLMPITCAFYSFTTK